MSGTHNNGHPPELAAYPDAQRVRISCDESIAAGPVVVAFDSNHVPVRIIAVDVLTTLGALGAFSHMRVLCPEAAVIVPGIARPARDDPSSNVSVHICEPDSQAEIVWWQQLLGWAAYRQ